MGIQKNLALIFTEVPTGLPVVGKHITVKDVGFDPERDAPVEGVTVELLYCSLDHFMRGLLREPVENEDVPEVMAGTRLGTPIRSEYSIGSVLKSRHPDFQPGDLILHRLPIQQFASVSLGRTHQAQRIPVDDGIDDVRHYLGALGMPGLTAYSGFYGIGRPKAGETIFVSSAASTVGQLVGQFAKSEGLNVIGSVGSEQKLQYILDELGFDQGFNYKKDTPLNQLKSLVPNGIQVYFDNVGGEHLEAAIDQLSSHGRIVACGQVSQYELGPEERYPIRNTILIVGKQISMQGFLVGDPKHGAKWAQDHQNHVTKMLKEGRLKAQFHEWHGIGQAAEAFVGMLKNENSGRAILSFKACT